MIKARHSVPADFFFRPYIKRLMKKSFCSMHLHGTVPETKDHPVILLPNHSTWWDGFFAYLINDIFFQKKFYIMIVERQLSKYRFFTKLGGFSIDHESPKKMIRSLQYAASILDSEKSPLMTIFPQGELLPNRIEDFSAKRGVGTILNNMRKPACLLPLAIRPMLLNEQVPHVFFKFGTAKIAGSGEFQSNLYAAEMSSLLNDIDESVFRGETGKTFFMGKKTTGGGTEDFFERLRKRNAR